MYKLGEANSTFVSELGKVFAKQLAFQVLFTLFLYFADLDNVLDAASYINISSYFFIFIISMASFKYSIANRPLVLFFVFEFLYLSISPIILVFANKYFQYNSIVILDRVNHIAIASILILITTYLFFYSISPKASEIKKHIILALSISFCIVWLSYSNIELFVDFYELGEEYYNNSLTNILLVDSYYVYLINLSFLLFIWFTYNQGQYILSEYLPAILSIHTLMIINEIYQLYNVTNLLDNYVDALYFNAVVNLGFIFLWLIRLNYLTQPESKKNEHYVLNYDLLKGFVEKPHSGFWEKVLIKIGKQKIFFGSLILFIIISIPLLFMGDFSYFTRFNIMLMLMFLVGVMIYGIVYTQKKWFTYVGFLIRRDKK